MATTARRNLEGQLDGAIDTVQLLEMQFNVNYQRAPCNLRETEAEKLFRGIDTEAGRVNEDALDLLDTESE